MLWINPIRAPKGISPLPNTPNPPPAPPPSSSAPQVPAAGPNRTRTLWLAIGIPVGVILLAIIMVAVLSWMRLLFADDVDANATLDGTKSVSVNAPNASLNFLPGTDDQVHVTMTGTRGQLDLVNVNGHIRVQDAASDTVNAETVNGAVELDFTAAPSAVTAASTNGAITVRIPDDGSSYAVSAVSGK